MIANRSYFASLRSVTSFGSVIVTQKKRTFLENLVNAAGFLILVLTIHSFESLVLITRTKL